MGCEGAGEATPGGEEEGADGAHLPPPPGGGAQGVCRHPGYVLQHQEGRKRELMVLIYRHLLEEGLKESADILGKYTCTLAPHSPTRCSNYLIWGGLTEPTWILEQQLNILILVMIHVQV